MLAIVFSLAALGSDFTWTLPDPPQPTPGECTQAADLVPGQPLPEGFLDEHGLVRCHATIVPTSQLGGLILTDAWARQAAPRGRMLASTLDWQEARYVGLLEAYSRPLPQADRNLGRVEGVLGAAILFGLYAAIDAAAEGGQQ